MVVPVDLIVPEAVAPPGGRRGARLGKVYGRRAARRAAGLEGALVERSPVEVAALDDTDVLRLFGATTPDSMALSLGRLLADPRSAGATRVAVGRLDGLFGTPRSVAVPMAVRTLDGVLDPATVEATLTGFTSRLLATLADT
ncbi:hypothetical protein BMS3Bbin01_01773 [bacterium BMS3Bbin01]|nr:hypothetical protein BMS3Bbin01_01773 [bacterium BMS3Bbin01]